MSWILNLAYLFTVLAASPILLYRMIVLKKYREGWDQKLFGLLPERTESTAPLVWLHAVSVGEILQLDPVLAEIRSRRPDVEFLISTTTNTGYALAKKRFTEHQVCFFPLDFSWAVRRAIARVRPASIVLVELELWPNFIFEASRRGIPLSLINGRISARSYRNYRFARGFMARLLGRFDIIAAQNSLYADRFRDLGAPDDRLKITGSIKFDRVTTKRDNLKTNELRESFRLKPADRVFIAGSTQSPEEELALDAYQELVAEFPNLRLILVPRHKERFDEVAKLVERRGLPLIRRSNVQPNDRRQAVGLVKTATAPVLLLDTLGELSACWGLAEVAFVGGSLTNRGGQNMIEPAAFGAAVLFGPNTWNFKDVVEVLLSHDAARVINSGNELTQTVRSLLANPADAAQYGRWAQELVLGQQGATARTVDLILPSITRNLFTGRALGLRAAGFETGKAEGNGGRIPGY
ncbi:MAG: 3-deoxy-D-manno-octulosonic acid transferase [Planctomycetaceae bacterium]